MSAIARDSGGNETTSAAVTISVATWTVGRFGRALSFDGVNDLVSVADSNSLDLSTGMTLQVWLQPRALNGYTTAILKERPSHLALLALREHRHQPRGRRDSGSDQPRYSQHAAAPLNSWSHLAATYDGAALHLYVNGALVSTRVVSGPITASASALRIGGNNVWGEFFNGAMDEVRIYNRALTAQEIQSDHEPAGSGATRNHEARARAPRGSAMESTSSGSVPRLGLRKQVPVPGHQPDEVLFVSQQLGLEPMQGGRQRLAPVPPLWRADEAEAGIGRDSGRVVAVFVAC